MGEVLGLAGEGVLREPGEEHSGWYEGGSAGADKKVRGHAAAPCHPEAAQPPKDLSVEGGGAWGREDPSLRSG